MRSAASHSMVWHSNDEGRGGSRNRGRSAIRAPRARRRSRRRCRSSFVPFDHQTCDPAASKHTPREVRPWFARGDTSSDACSDDPFPPLFIVASSSRRPPCRMHWGRGGVAGGLGSARRDGDPAHTTNLSNRPRRQRCATRSSSAFGSRCLASASGASTDNASTRR